MRQTLDNSPAVNLIKILFTAGLPILQHKVFTNPRHQVIFKGALDYLVQDITGQQFMNIGAREIIGKWLR